MCWFLHWMIVDENLFTVWYVNQYPRHQIGSQKLWLCLTFGVVWPCLPECTTTPLYVSFAYSLYAMRMQGLKLAGMALSARVYDHPSLCVICIQFVCNAYAGP